MTGTYAALMVVLLFGHFLGDFSPLLTSRMLAAKESGAAPGWILGHAGVHAALVGLAVLVVVSPPVLVLGLAILIELSSHFVIDVLRARLGVARPGTRDPANRSFWLVLGLDQLAHGLVLVAIVWLVAGG